MGGNVLKDKLIPLTPIEFKKLNTVNVVLNTTMMIRMKMLLLPFAVLSVILLWYLWKIVLLDFTRATFKESLKCAI